MNPYCWLSMANCVFIVNAANPMLFRSSAAMMKRMKTKGRIRLRTLRIVRASMSGVMVPKCSSGASALSHKARACYHWMFRPTTMGQ